MAAPTQRASELAIRHAATVALGLDGLTVEELASRLAAAGLDLGADPDRDDRIVEALDNHGDFVELENERWCSTRNQLAGLAFTTRVSETDAAAARLRLQPDLTLLGWLTVDATLRLASGEELLDEETDEGDFCLVGPDGWLDAVSGTSAVVSLDGDVLDVAPRAEPPVSESLVAALRVTFDTYAETEHLRTGLRGGEDIPLTTMMLEDLWWEALVAHRDAFTGGPIPTFEQLAAEAGLETDGVSVADRGFDWSALERWQLRARLGHFHHVYEAHLDGVERLIDAIEDVYATLEDGEERSVGVMGPAFGAQLAADFEDPATAKAVWGHFLADRAEPVVLGLFAMRVIEALDAADSAGVDDVPSHSGGAHWFAGRALDLMGKAVEAEAAHRLSATMGFPLGYRALAAFAADRGDAKGAYELLRLANLDHEHNGDDKHGHDGHDGDDELLTEVQGYATVRPKPLVGRNDRCPCGSGRKYKACHLGREEVALLDRGYWLYDKARRYLRDNRWRWFVAEIADTIAKTSGRGGFFVLQLMESEPVADLVLYEGGVFENFLAERRELLPADEAEVAAQWLARRRSLFEVTGVSADTLALVDVATGEPVAVTNTSSESEAYLGQLFLGRPLPIAGTWRSYSGFVPVPPSQRAEVLALVERGDPYELAAFMGSRFAAPRHDDEGGPPERVEREELEEGADPTATPSKPRSTLSLPAKKTVVPASPFGLPDDPEIDALVAELLAQRRQ